MSEALTPTERELLRTIAHLDQCGYQTRTVDFMMQLIDVLVKKDDSLADAMVAVSQALHVRGLDKAAGQVDKAIKTYIEYIREKQDNASNPKS